MKQELQKLNFAAGLRWVVVFVAMVLFLSGAAIAKDKTVCLDAKAVENIKLIYLNRRDVNMAALKNMLRAKKQLFIAPETLHIIMSKWLQTIHYWLR